MLVISATAAASLFRTFGPLTRISIEPALSPPFSPRFRRLRHKRAYIASSTNRGAQRYEHASLESGLPPAVTEIL
jgi:hypothetical protein